MQSAITALESQIKALLPPPANPGEGYTKLVGVQTAMLATIKLIASAGAASENAIQSVGTKVQTCESALQSINASMHVVQTAIANQPAQSNAGAKFGSKPAAESRCVSSLPTLGSDKTI